MNTLSEAMQAAWQFVPALAYIKYEKSASVAKRVHEVIADMPPGLINDIWHRSDNNHLFANVGEWADHEEKELLREALQSLATAVRIEEESHPPGFASGDWVKIAFFRKEAYSESMRRLGGHLGFFPEGLSQYIPGAPSPLAATLAGGLAGGALGYGGAWLASQATPRSWDRSRMRRNWAMIGALAGAAPGAVWAVNNAAGGRPMNDSSVFNTPPDKTEHYSPVLGDGKPNPEFDPAAEYVRMPRFKGACESAPVQLPEHIKQAVSYGMNGFGSFDPDPAMDVNHFSDTVWYDPRVAPLIPPPIRAAATGLMEGAARLAGGSAGTQFVFPTDVGRMALGMGSGYMSGLLVGKALGALMGMPEPVQDRLKQTGMWAGLVTNLVPMAFGR